MFFNNEALINFNYIFEFYIWKRKLMIMLKYCVKFHYYSNYSWIMTHLSHTPFLALI